MPVHVIEALPSVSIIPQAEQEQRKKNVIGYARVSTTEQESSYESQLAYFEDLIKRNPDWNFCGMYSDESSGTTTKKRDGFNRMIQACEAGGVDIIVCKSLSRFSRNVVDAISGIRRLRELGVNLWLQKENVWTMEESGELLLVVLSSLAQAESQSISVNVSLGIRYKMQRGIPMINCSRFLGYDKDPVTKKLVINADEAKVVRFIYRAFLEGFSIPEIGKKLREAHIPSGSGRSDWPTESIRYILQNEKYVGDLLMQKTYCKSFLTHRMVKNKGKLPQYFVADNHDPLVPREIWNLTQSEMVRRGKVTGHPGQRRYSLSGKVICGCCGTEYKRFAGARMVPTVSTDTLPSLPAAPAALPSAVLGNAERVETVAALPAPAETQGEGQGAERVEISTSGHGAEYSAVWKCKARVSRKDAASAYARLFPERATSSPDSQVGGNGMAATDAHSEGGDNQATAPRVGNEEGETIPAANQDKLTWRCENAIVGEEKLLMAVDRALALLPGEEPNILLIREECLKVLADGDSPSPAAGSHTAAPGSGEHTAPGSVENEKKQSAQILLLHIDTALDYLTNHTLHHDIDAGSHTSRDGAGGSPSVQGSHTSAAGMPRVNRDSLPCKTFQQFMEWSSADITTTPPDVAGRIEQSAGVNSAGEHSVVDLLVERVIIDGDRVRVVFKAGVEV